MHLLKKAFREMPNASEDEFGFKAPPNQLMVWGFGGFRPSKSRISPSNNSVSSFRGSLRNPNHEPPQNHQAEQLNQPTSPPTKHRSMGASNLQGRWFEKSAGIFGSFWWRNTLAHPKAGWCFNKTSAKYAPQIGNLPQGWNCCLKKVETTIYKEPYKRLELCKLLMDSS